VVMVSYSLASLVLPWIAWQLPSWHYLAAMASAAVLPVLCCCRYKQGVTKRCRLSLTDQ
jgi:hypothetical protein